ncbi:MAG TPA: hypothetical protein VHE35_09365 [Kofleriaceae bacterium]|nr:hypothetical protein [Kofleriaceae bacterium]
MATTYGNTGSMGHTGSMGNSSLGNASSFAKDKLDQTSDQIKHAVDTGVERAGEVGSKLRDKLADAKDRLVDASGTVKDKILDAKDVVVDRAGSGATTLKRAIKDHPFIAIGVAFGIGYIAMRLIRR